MIAQQREGSADRGGMAPMAEGHRILSEAENAERIRLIDTDRTQELMRSWENLFEAAERGLITRDQFDRTMRRSESMLTDLMHSVPVARLAGTKDADDGGALSEEKIHRLREYTGYGHITDYEADVLQLIRALHECTGLAGTENERKIRIAMRYVQENYARDLNMAVVSNYVSMNYSLFSAMFKQCAGMNYAAYVRRLRIDRARDLLATTEESAAAIGRSVGYENGKHFIKSFKLETGLTPSEYRRNLEKVVD